jgi:hypothetical protein
MLEGIREGVQGVSRLIAAGLGELSPVPAPSSPSLGQKPSRRHSTQPSTSSVSTYTTNVSDSTRLSQSSASSLGDESTLREEGGDNEKDTDGGTELLVARDTGEHPTLSASLALERMLSDSSSDIDSDGKALANERTMKIHRRKSRDRAKPPPLLPLSSNSFDPSTTTDSTGVKHIFKAKRASTNGPPPVASIPGVGSLAAVSSSGDQPVASWVDSMGKKWEEIQRGHTYVLSFNRQKFNIAIWFNNHRFTKGQKRASLLFSDMSQTIASALSVPPVTPVSYNPAPRPPLRPSSSSSASASGSITPLQTSSSVSLLDEDDTETTAQGGLGRMGLGDVMKPVHVSAQQSPHVNTSSGVKEVEGAVAAQVVDDDEEWGW